MSGVKRQSERLVYGKTFAMNINKYQNEGVTLIKYYIDKITDYHFDEAIDKVTEALKVEGFGILTEIDVQATLKKKLDVDLKPYKILGACNPPNAYKALQAEEQIGLMLPCNVIVYVNDESKTVVAAVDPIVSMQAVENEQLAGIANEIRTKLEKVIHSL